MKKFDWDKLGEQAYNYVFEKTYLEKTGVLYDYIINPPTEEMLKFYPQPEEIQDGFPNACGWHTGMEEGMISAGSMLNAIVNRYHATKDKSLAADAERIVKGMYNCATVSGQRGFLARSICPADGKSFYKDTSRDQYTMTTYGLGRYYVSGLCPEDRKPVVADILLSFAERAEQNITPENDYHYLRADGERGAVDKMWNVSPHEWLRLPMIYLAAWKTGGGDKYLDLYNGLFDKAIEESFKYTNIWHGYQITYQAQVSARLCWEFDPDPAHREKLEEFMAMVADQCKDKAAQINAEIEAGEYHLDVGTPDDWRKGAFYYGGRVGTDRYFLAGISDDWSKNALGGALLFLPNAINIRMTSPRTEVSDAEIEVLGKVMDMIDYDTFSTRCMVYVADAFWWCKLENRI